MDRMGPAPVRHSDGVLAAMAEVRMVVGFLA